MPVSGVGTTVFIGTGVNITAGSGSPEGVVVAVVGSLWIQTDGTSGEVLWRKATGSGNTGWISYASVPVRITIGDGAGGEHGIFQKDDNHFIAIAGGSSEDPAHGAYIDVSGNGDAGAAGWIIYGTGSVGGSLHDWQVAGAETMRLNGTELYPATAGAVALGTTALPWGKIYFKPGTAVAAARASGVLFQTGGQTTTSTSEASVISYTLKGNTINTDRQQLRITLYGVEATQAGTIVVKLGATNLLSEAVASGENFRVTCDFFRQTSSTSSRASMVKSGLVGAGVVVVRQSDTGTITDDLSTDLTLDFRGSVTAGGTLTYRLITVEYIAGP